MKYFTRELWLRGQSKDDDVLDAVEAEWQQRCEQYRAYLATIDKEFPPGLKDLRARFCLHDARILNVGRHDHTFVINLQLDTPPYSFVTLTYELMGEPVILHEELPRELQGSGAVVWWQYEEVERLPGEPPQLLRRLAPAGVCARSLSAIR